MKITNQSYEKSNKIETVKYSRLSKTEYKALLNASDMYLDRQRAGQKLLNYLCDKYSISQIPLIVTDTPQKGNGKCKTLGFYRMLPAFQKGQSITIYNLTAVKKKVVSIKVFIDTLLHEFIHHYDTEYLKIESAYTAGFYKRISDLKNKLS